MDYPIFENPEQYLKRRAGKWAVFRKLKVYFEDRAIEQCLALTTGISSVCDVPCGPGRKFGNWAKRGWEVYGLDLGDEMVEAARTSHDSLSLKGKVELANIFESDNLPRVDLYVSVRFIYYFEKEKRIELLKILSRASNRYVLVQYKSIETRKGRKNAHRQKDEGAYTKYFCTHDDIRQEIESSGMKFLCLKIIDQSSDRIFILAMNQ